MADSDTGSILPANTEQFVAEPPPAGHAAALQRPASINASYGHAWQQLKRYFLPLFLIGLIVFIISAVAGGLIGGLGALFGGSGGQDQATGVAIIGGIADLLFQFLVTVPLAYGSYYAYLKAARDDGPEVSDLFVAYRRAFLSSVLTSVLLGICIGIGFLLLVIPGIILSVRLAFAPLLVVDEGLGPTAALAESWRRTSGHFWTIFGVWLLAIPITFIGLLLFVIGLIPAVMWIYLAFASLYAAVSARAKANASPWS
jgi:uncharacterized membrane protein